MYSELFVSRIAVVYWIGQRTRVSVLWSRHRRVRIGYSDSELVLRRPATLLFPPNNISFFLPHLEP